MSCIAIIEVSSDEECTVISPTKKVKRCPYKIEPSTQTLVKVEIEPDTTTPVKNEIEPYHQQTPPSDMPENIDIDDPIAMPNITTPIRNKLLGPRTESEESDAKTTDSPQPPSQEEIDYMKTCGMDLYFNGYAFFFHEDRGLIF